MQIIIKSNITEILNKINNFKNNISTTENEIINELTNYAKIKSKENASKFKFKGGLVESINSKIQSNVKVKKGTVFINGNQAKAIANEFGRSIEFLSFSNNPELKQWALAKIGNLNPKIKGLTVGKPPNSRQILGNSKNKFMYPSYKETVAQAKPIIINKIIETLK